MATSKILLPELLIIASYLAIGCIAGLLAGLLGVGGGLVIVPLLTLLYSLDNFPSAVIVQCAVATSLASIIVTSSVSFYSHHKHGAVLWPPFRQLGIGIIIGAALGAIIATNIDGASLKVFFGLFELLVALQMIAGLNATAKRDLPRPVVNGVNGIGIGAISSLLGIGGGTMTVPYLVWCGVKVHKAVGTSAALGLPLALAGSASFVVLTTTPVAMPPQTLGFIHLPSLLGIVVTSALFAPLGVKLAHRLPTKQLRTVFAGFLAFLGMAMLLG